MLSSYCPVHSRVIWPNADASYATQGSKSCSLAYCLYCPLPG